MTLDLLMLKLELSGSWVRSFGDRIAQAYSYGIEESHAGEPWSIEFHRAARPILSETVPDAYLSPIASSLIDSLHILDSHSVALNDPRHRTIFTTFVENFSNSNLASREPFFMNETTLPDATAPSIFRYDKLARLVTLEAVIELQRSADAVQFCRRSLKVPRVCHRNSPPWVCSDSRSRPPW